MSKGKRVLDEMLEVEDAFDSRVKIPAKTMLYLLVPKLLGQAETLPPFSLDLSFSSLITPSSASSPSSFSSSLPVPTSGEEDISDNVAVGAKTFVNECACFYHLEKEAHIAAKQLANAIKKDDTGPSWGVRVFEYQTLTAVEVMDRPEAANAAAVGCVNNLTSDDRKRLQYVQLHGDGSSLCGWKVPRL